MNMFWKKLILFGSVGVILNVGLLYVASREMAAAKPDVRKLP